MTEKQEWDIALGPVKGRASLLMNLPSPISRVLVARGQLRAKVTITEAGLLLTPYKSDPETTHGGTAVLPEWDAK